MVMWAVLAYYTVSQKNEKTSASGSFNKRGLILIILSKWHQHTFKNYMHILLSLSLHFCLLYLPLNTAMEMNRNIMHFPCRRLVLMALKRGDASKKSRFDFAICSKWCSFTFTLHISTFSIDKQLHQWLFVICFYASPSVNEVLLQVAGVTSFPSQLF